MRLAEDGKHREAGDGNAGDLSPAQLAAHQAAHQAATRAPAAYDLLKQASHLPPFCNLHGHAPAVGFLLPVTLRCRFRDA